MTPYEQDLEPLLDCVEIIYLTELTPFILAEKHKYEEDFLISESSTKDFMAQIKLSTRSVMRLTSKELLKKLQRLYFSEEGLIMFIFTTLHKLTVENGAK